MLLAVFVDAQTLIAEYRLNFEGNAGATVAYYQRKRQRALPVYQVDLKVLLKRANPVLQLFLPDLAVADGSRVDGSFRNGETSIFQLGGHLDSLRYGPVRTVNDDFDFLSAYYAGLRGRLEGRLLMGQRRADKHDRG